MQKFTRSYHKTLISILKLVRIMKRRDLLAKTGLTATILAGCLNENRITYEQCRNTLIDIPEDLPKPAKIEMSTAIEENEYRTSDNLVLPQAFNLEKTYFTTRDNKNDRIYYKAKNKNDGDTNRLRVERSAPKCDELKLYNGRRENLTFDIRLKYSNVVPLDKDRTKSIIENKGRVLVEETVDVEAQGPLGLEREEVPKDTTTLALNSDEKYRYGSYQADVSINELDLKESITWTMWREYTTIGWIGVSSSRGLYHRHGGDMVDERRDCKWNSDGDLIHSRSGI